MFTSWPALLPAVAVRLAVSTFRAEVLEPMLTPHETSSALDTTSAELDVPFVILPLGAIKFMAPPVALPPAPPVPPFPPTPPFTTRLPFEEVRKRVPLLEVVILPEVVMLPGVWNTKGWLLPPLDELRVIAVVAILLTLIGPVLLRLTFFDASISNCVPPGRTCIPPEPVVMSKVPDCMLPVLFLTNRPLPTVVKLIVFVFVPPSAPFRVILPLLLPVVASVMVLGVVMSVTVEISPIEVTVSELSGVFVPARLVST